MSLKFPDEWVGHYLTIEAKDQMMLNPLEHLEENKKIDQNISENCKTVCGSQSECYSEYYRINLKPYARNYGMPFISIFAPVIPDLVYVYLPKMYFIEFMLFVASSVSLWFGFSVFMLSDVILKLFSVIQNKSKTIKAKIFIKIHHKVFVKNNPIST